MPMIGFQEINGIPEMIGNRASLRFTLYGIRDVVDGCKIRPGGVAMASTYFREACVFYRYWFYF